MSSNSQSKDLKLYTLLDIYQMFEEHINKLLAGLVALILTGLGAFFRKLPQYYLEAKQLNSFNKVMKLDILLDDLVEETDAIYGHIIKYHDGDKELQAGDKWRMTVTWESVGKPCSDCDDKCKFSKIGNRKRLQTEWQDVPITSGWFKIVSKSYLDKSNCHFTSIDDKDMLEMEKAIFRRSNIHTFVEMMIKIKDKNFYTLGLSFCDKHKKLSQCASISLAVRQLSKLV